MTNLSRPVKVVVGLATAIGILIPFAIGPFAVAAMFLFGGLPFGDPRTVADPDLFGRVFPVFFLTFFPFLTCAGVVQLGLQVFYIIHILSNERVLGTTRILFVLGTFLMGYVAMPVYFVLHVWPDAPGGAATESQAP